MAEKLVHSQVVVVVVVQAIFHAKGMQRYISVTPDLPEVVLDWTS